jgi:branched-chain amino acid transport system substrate-binding protein
MQMNKWLLSIAVSAVALPPITGSADDMTGVTATEIKIGNTMPYSGPAATQGTIGKAMSAYFNTFNRAGGVAGHKINFISLDDGYSPPKAVELTRRLVEQEHVAFIFAPHGTAPSLATRKYLNEHKVPQLNVLSGISTWNDPQHYPYSMGGIPSYIVDGKMVASYVLKHVANAKIAVLYQNDDLGRDHLAGLKRGLGDKVGMIVKEATFEVADPTVDSQVIELRASGADVLYIVALPKAAAQTIRKADEIGWKPLRFISYVAASISATLTPAGLNRSIGIVSHLGIKDPLDPTWKNDPFVKDYVAWMNSDFPNPDIKNGIIEGGYIVARTLVVTHLKNFQQPGLLPGVTINTSPTDYTWVSVMRDIRFNGERWELLPADQQM